MRTQRTLKTSKSRILRQLSSLFKIPYNDNHDKFILDFDESPNTQYLTVALQGAVILDTEIHIIPSVVSTKSNILHEYFYEDENSILIVKDVGSLTKKSLFVCAFCLDTSDLINTMPESTSFVVGPVLEPPVCSRGRLLAYPMHECVHT